MSYMLVHLQMDLQTYSLKFWSQRPNYVGECPTKERTNKRVTITSRKGVSLWLHMIALWVCLNHFELCWRWFTFSGLVSICNYLGHFTSCQNDMKMTHIWPIQLMLVFACQTSTKFPYMPSNHKSYNVLCFVIIMRKHAKVL